MSADVPETFQNVLKVFWGVRGCKKWSRNIFWARILSGHADPPLVGTPLDWTTCPNKGHDEIVSLNLHIVDESRGNNCKHNIFPCELIILMLLAHLRMNVNFFQKNISFCANIQLFPWSTFSYTTFPKEEQNPSIICNLSKINSKINFRLGPACIQIFCLIINLW